MSIFRKYTRKLEKQNNKAKGLSTRDFVKNICLSLFALGYAALPNFGEAADVNVISGAQDVFAQSVKGDVAVNKFGSFNVSKDAVANMYFHRQNESAEASKLFNFVDSKININGTVNAIHNAKVGGDLYFLSKQGMVVGASGAINAGSLTVLTPTEKWWDDHAVDVTTDKINVNDISNLKVPVNASGTITVLGNINAVNSVKMKAATINVGVDSNGTEKTYHKANINTGVVNFTNLVKMTDEQLAAAGIGEENNASAGLVLNKTTDGKIVIAAENTSNASWGVSDTANLTATVNVAGGSQIIADGVADSTGNKNNAVSITAMATHNAGVVEFTKDGEKYYKVGGYDAPLSESEYKKLFPGGAKTVFYTNVDTKAEINITNDGATDGAKTTIKGERVDIEALAANALETSKYLPSNIKNIEKLAASIAFQGVDASVGMLDNTATVNIGANTIVKAEGADVNIQAKADETLEIGSNVFGFNALSLIYPNASLLIPGVAINFGVAHNKAQVTLGGSVEADHGSVNVEALAKHVFHATATTALTLDALPAEGFINFAHNNMKGSNTSKVEVLQGASITADNKNSTDRQNVKLRADAQNDVKIIGNASMGDKGAITVGVSVVDYDSEATVNVDGTVRAKNELRAEAESRYSQNEVVMNNSAGAGYFWNVLRAPLLESHTIGNIGQGIAGLLEIFHADIMNQTNSAFQDAGSFLKLGISVNKVNEINKANVNVGEQGTLVASAADSAVTIGAQSLLEGNHVSVVGASSNCKSPKDTSTKVLVNGGILLSDFDNDANVIIKGDANTKGDKISGGNVNVYGKAEAKFDRIAKKIAILKGYNKSIGDIIKEDNPSADTVYLYNKYNAIMTEFTDFMEHTDDMQEVAKKQQELEANPYIIAFNSLISTGRASYVDDNKANRTASFTTSQKQKIDKSAPGFLDMASVIVSFISPETYVSYHAGVSTNGQATPEAYAAVGVSGSFAKTNFKNKSKVLVGNDVTIHGNDDVKLTTAAESGEVSFDGKLGLLSGGKYFSGGIAVGVHDLDTANIISVGEKTSIITGKTIDFDAKLKSKHVGIASGLGMSKNNELIGNVELLDVNSNNLIAIDDEASLDATSLRLNGINDSSVVNVTGGYAMGNKSGLGLAIGINDIKRNNLVAVTDTDGVQALKDTTIITESNKKEGQQVDDEETRLRKLLAANVKSDKDKLFGTKTATETAGTISASSIVGDAHTEGLMVLLSADLGEVMPGDNENPGIGSRFSTWLGNRKDDIKDQLKIFDDFIASAINSQVERWDGIGVRKEAANPDAGKAMPSFTLDGSGSISLADLDGATATVINSNIAGNKKLNINMKNVDNNSNKIKLHASDDSCFVNLSGGIVFGMPAYMQQPDGFSSTFLSLAGGVAYNNSNTSVYSAIENSNIENVDEISNTATREGAISAIAAAVDIVVKYGDKAPTGLGLAGGVSIDVGKASTKAVLANNNVNTAGNNTKHAMVQNIATTKDIEVTGAIELDVSSGKNKNIGIGAAVTRGYLKNAVEAVVDGGTYKSLSGLTNEAVTEMTQVDAVIGGGVSKSSTGTSANVSVQGAVAYNAIDNYINAKVTNAVIDTDTLEVMAYDTRLDGSPNKYAKMLQDKYHVDTDGAGFIDLAKQNAELKDIGNHGGSVITAGLQFTGANASHDSLGLTVAGSVVANNINNNYNALVDGVTLNKDAKIKSGNQPVTAKVLAESSTLVVDVAAGISIETGEKSFQGAGSVANNYVSGGVSSKVANSNLYVDKLNISAEDKNKFVNVAADLQYGSKTIGVHNAINNMHTLTNASMLDTDVNKAEHDKDDEQAKTGVAVDVDAKNTANYYAVAAGAGAGSIGLTGAVAMNFGNNDIEAIIGSSSASKKHSINNIEKLNVHTQDDTHMSAGAGGFFLANSLDGKIVTGASIGGAFAENDLGHKFDGTDKTQINKAEINNYIINTLNNSASAIDVAAKDTAHIITVGSGVAIALGEGSIGAVEGAGAYTRLNKNAEAALVGVDVDKDNTGSSKSRANVEAKSDNNITNVAVVASVGLSSYVAAGGAVAITDTNTNTKAHADNSNMKIDNLMINGKGQNDVTSIAVGATGGTDYVTAAGSVNINNLGDSVSAYIDGGTYSAKGNIGVLADGNEKLKAGAGTANIGVALDKLFGASAGLSMIKNNFNNNNVLAYVEDADISAEGSATDSFGKAIDALAYHDSTNINKIKSENTENGSTKPFDAVTKSARGIVVDALGKQDVTNSAVTAGGTIAYDTPASITLAGALTLSEMGGKTHAYINNSDVNKNKANYGDVAVTAYNIAEMDDVADNTDVSINIGLADFAANASFGFSAAKENLTRDVLAEIKGKSAKNTLNAKALKVKAAATNDISDTVVGANVNVTFQPGEGVAIALGGNANDNLVYSTNTVIANVENVTGQNSGMDIEANHFDRFESDGVGVLVEANIPTDKKAIFTKISGDAIVGYTGMYETNTISASLVNADITHPVANEDNAAPINDIVKANNYTDHDLATTDISANISVLSVGTAVGLINEKMTDTLSVNVIGSTITNGNRFDAVADNTMHNDTHSVQVKVGGFISVAVSEHELDIAENSQVNIADSTIKAADINVSNNELRDIKLKKEQASVISAINVGYARNYVTVNDKLSLNNSNDDAANIGDDDADNRAQKEAQQEKLIDKLDKAVIKQYTRTKDDDGHSITPLLQPAAASDISLKGETGAGKALKGMQTELEKAVLAAQNVNINNTINDKFAIYTGSGTGSIIGVIKNRALLEEKNLSQINIAGGSVDAKNIAINGNVTGTAEAETVLGYVSGVAGNTSWAKITVAGENDINITAATDDKAQKIGTKINAQNVEIKANNDGKYTSTAKGGGLAVAGGNELTTRAEDNLNNRVNISDVNIAIHVEKPNTEETVKTGLSIDAAQTSKVNTKTIFGNVSVVGGGVSFYMDSKLNSDNVINLANNTIKETLAGQGLNLNALYAGVAELEAKNGSGSLGGGGSGTYATAIAKGSAVINATGNDLDVTNIKAYSLVGGKAGKDGNDAMTLAKADVHAIDISMIIGGSKNSSEAKIETTSKTDFSNNTFHNTTQNGNVIGYTEIDQLIEETDKDGHIILDENGKPKMKVALVKKLDEDGKEVKDPSGNPIMVPVKIKAPIYEQIPVGKTDLNIKADTIARGFANDDGANVGLGVAVGHKESKVTINETTKANFAVKADATTYLKSLEVDATGLNEVVDTADGSGGGILGISPSAATTENNLKLITNSSVKGKINVFEKAEIVAKQKDNLKINTTIKNGGVLVDVGGGTATNKLNEDTAVDLSDADLVAQESVISASNDVSLNSEQSGGNDTYAVKGDSGSVGWSHATDIVFTNNITTKADVNFNNAKVTTYDDLKVNADTVNNIFAKASYTNGGAVAVAEAKTKNTHSYTNAINLSQDSSLKTINSDSRIDLVAADNSNLQVGAYANAVFGLGVTVAMPETNSTIVRNNNINLKGNVFSNDDINIYAGDFLGVDIGGLDAVIDCEAYSGSIIPITNRKFESNITENNTIVIAGNSNSIGDTNINATEGSTRIKHNYIEGALISDHAHRTSEYVSMRRLKFNNDHLDSGIVNITNNDNLEISGSVTAGTNYKFALDIGTDKEIVILDDAERNAVKAADNGDLTVAARPTIKLNGQVLTEAEAEDNIGEIKYYASGVGKALLDRYDEINSAVKEYSDVTDRSKDPTYQKLLLERDSIINTLYQLGLAHQVGEGDAKYWVVDNKVKANVIELPDIASGGGSINIQADDMTGKGTIKAYGAPDLVVNNYSNMYLKLNNMTVGELGGRLTVNDDYINCIDTERANQMISNVLHKCEPKEFGEVIATGGSESKIEINGINSIREIKAIVNGNTITEVPYASIELSKNKSITNNSGKVKIDSRNDSLFINGNVVGTEVSMTAFHGNLTQVVDKGILNVGGAPELDANYTNSINKILDEKFRFTKDNVVSEGVKHKEEEYKDNTTHGREDGYLGIITGGNIFLGAESINVNGLVQSGFGEYFINIDHYLGAMNKINEMDAAWDGIPLKDSEIKTKQYMLSAPGQYYDKATNLYKYRVGAYYNPSTKKIVVDDIESYSGSISLAGGIISTGNGRIVALDGAYDIKLFNNTERDLQLGKILTTESKGKITIHDTYLGTTTEYTRDGGANQVYKPKEGIRYNWEFGTNSTIRQFYEHKYESNWWGLHKDVDETTPGSTVVKTERLDNKNKDKVSYIDLNLKSKDGSSLEDSRFYIFGSNNYLSSHKSDVKKTSWETGLFGFRKHILSEWNVTTGSSQQYLASAKADMPIAIQFIGHDKGTIDVNSNASVDLTGNIGSKEKDNATVNIKAENGLINQNSGAIMASNVNLEAAGHMSGINIRSGNVLNLNAGNIFHKDSKIFYNGKETNVNDGNKIDITIKNEVKGFGDSADYGHVNLTGIIGSVWDKNSVQAVSIKASGSIYENDGYVDARRIDLESTNGQIGNANHYIKVKAGQDVTTTDTLSASINAKAKGDINLEHNWIGEESATNGDMRIGTIYSENGDVNLKAYGRIIDALPYENIEASGRSEEELIAHWKSLGVVGESETLAKDENGKYITTTTPNGNPVYKTITVIRDGKEVTVIATEKVRDVLLDEQGNPMKDKDGNILYGAEHEVRIQEKDANGKPLYYETTTVAGWDAERMLYAISDDIINPKAGVELPTKAANIKAHNITIETNYSAGLNSDEVWEADISDLSIDDLKFLAKQDASNVIWNNPNKEGGKEGYIVVRKKLPLGINQSEGGTLTITAGKMYDEGHDLDVNIEGRPLDPEAAIIPIMDINIMKIDTYGNAMLKNSLGGIYTAAASQNNTAPTAVIRAKNLDINAASTTLEAGNIGVLGDANSPNMPLYVNLSGLLHATATGDINIQQLNDNDLIIESVSAGGNIRLVSENSILGANSATDAKTSNGYIRLENDNTTLSLLAKNGNVGSAKQRINIANTEEQETDGNRKVIVEAHHINAHKDNDGSVYIHGIQNPTTSLEPAGTLYVDSITAGNSGIVNIDSFGSILINGNNINHNNVSLNAAKDVEIIADDYKAEGITIIAGMYGNKIYGGDLIINAHSLEINSIDDFRIHADDSKEKGNIKLYSDTYVKNTGPVHAQNNIYITAGTDIVNTEYMTAHGDIVFTAGNDIDNSGRFEIFNDNKNVIMTAGNNIINSNIIQIKGNIEFISSNGSLVNKSDILIARNGSVTFKSKDTLENTANIETKNDITLESSDNTVINNGNLNSHEGEVKILADKGSIINNNSSTDSRKGITVHAASAISQTGTLSTSAGDIEVVSENGNVDINDGSIIKAANGSVILKSKEALVYNAKSLSAGDKLVVESSNDKIVFKGETAEVKGKASINAATSIEINTEIHANDDFTINAGTDFEEKGNITSKNNMIIHAGNNLTVGGVVGAVEGNVEVVSENGAFKSFGNGGLRSEAGSVTIKSKETLENNTAVSAKKDITMESSASDVLNTGSLNAKEGAITIVADKGSITNKGGILSAAGITTTAGTDFANIGSIAAESDIVVHAGDNISLGNSITSNSGNVEMVAENGGLFNNAQLLEAKNGSVTMKSEELLLNSTEIKAKKDITMESSASDVLNTGSLNAAEGSVKILADNGSIIANGDIISGADITITAGTDFANIGSIAAESDIVVHADDSITLSNKITSNSGNVEMVAENGGLFNNAQLLEAKNGSVTMKSEALLLNSAEIKAKKDITMESSASDVLNSGHLEAVEGKVTILATKGSINDRNSGIEASKGITLNAANDIVQNGALSTQDGDIEIISNNGSLTTSGEFLINAENGSVILKSKEALKNHVQDITAGNDIVLESGTNIEVAYGHIDAKGNVNINAGTSVENRSKIKSQDKITITAGTDFANKNSIAAESDIVIHAGDNITVNRNIESNAGNLKIVSENGAFNSDYHIYLRAGNGDAIIQSMNTLDNKANVKAQNNVVLRSKADVKNTGNLTAVKGNVIIDAGKVAENSGMVTAGNNATVQAGAVLNNGYLSADKIAVIRTKNGDIIIGDVDAGYIILYFNEKDYFVFYPKNYDYFMLHSILNYKASDTYTKYFADKMHLFERYNLYELPATEIVNGQLINTLVDFKLTEKQK